MTSLIGWGWLSNETLAFLVLSCEVGLSGSELQRFNEMRLVAHVILNRVESEKFAESSVPEVVLAPRQFSCVGDERWRGLLLGHKTRNYPRYWPPIIRTARLAWQAALHERNTYDEDPVDGATMYFSPVSMTETGWNTFRTMPKGWPLDLIETTPRYIDANRFRFFAFEDDTGKHKVRSDESGGEIRSPSDVRYSSIRERDPWIQAIPEPDSPIQRDPDDEQPARATRYDATGRRERR